MGKHSVLLQKIGGSCSVVFLPIASNCSSDWGHLPTILCEANVQCSKMRLNRFLVKNSCFCLILTPQHCKNGWEVNEFYIFYNFCYIHYIIYNNNTLSLQPKYKSKTSKLKNYEQNEKNIVLFNLIINFNFKSYEEIFYINRLCTCSR